MSRIPFKLYILPFILLLLYSCKTYKVSRMFETDVEYINDSIQAILDQPDHTMKIADNDYISVMVYTAKGEKLIDPDNQLSKVTSPDMKASQGANVTKYQVKIDGKATLPMIGEVYLRGYTCKQADSLLTIAYSKYYIDSYVLTKMLNKRVIVFGPMGGKVINIDNDNISIIEAIALYNSTGSAGGSNSYSKMNKVRVIRGDLKNPHVQIIDLQTIVGMKQASLALLPGDIIYMEPQRKVLTEAMNDFIPLLTTVTTLLTLAILLGIVKIN